MSPTTRKNSSTSNSVSTRSNCAPTSPRRRSSTGCSRSPRNSTACASRAWTACRSGIPTSPFMRCANRPAAYLTCNFAPPLPGQLALLTHEEVLTLFHEFGHGLQHLLTRVDEAAVSGIRGVAWDAVELPSQFMENWAYHGPALARFARHFQTGAPLPEALLRKLKASRRFQAGLATLRQIEYALFDLRLHLEEKPQIYPLLERVRDEVALLKPPAWNRMPHAFSHIFAGGYAAGYYSYKWAEVLSADAFAAFEEAGFAPDVGRRFRDTVLALGGSKEAAEVYREFRGRDPALEPLLRQDGLIEA